MASREGHRPLASRVLARSTRRAGAALVAAIGAASAAVAVLEGLALATPWPRLAVLGVGAVLTVVLAWVFGGARLVRRHAEAMRDLAVDDVTGAWSRRAFAADLPDAVAARSTEAATSGPLTLALVELTGVDTAVELFGRRRAEALVREAAASLDPAGPQRATYRLSGEVFAVVLTGVGPDAAFDVADTLLDGLSRSAAPLSAVAGLCTLDARCPDAEMLMIGASAALDEARTLGPGRIVASAGEQTGLRWVATPGT